MPSKAESQAAMEVQRPPDHLPLSPPVEPAPLATTDTPPLSFEGFVEAVSTGKMSADAVEKLTDVFLKVQAARAEQDYNVAFAAFRRECPPPPRKHVREWKKARDEGTGFTTYYADTETILRTVSPVLAAHGLCISFGDADLKETKGAMLLIEHCRCSHVGGHFETASSPMPLESASPAMSAQDRFDAASTRARRQALQKVLGIWTEGYTPGTDAEPEPPAPSPLLTEEQRQHIVKLAGEVKQNRDDLLKWWGVSKNEKTGNREIAEATQDRYLAAVDFLNRKLAEQTKGTQ